MEPKTRILVVDDSAFMRKALTNLIQSDPGLEVIATARDGEEAVEKVLSLKPDLVTLDIEMPRVNGLEALKTIMEKSPVPVLMVSSLTEEGAKATLDALELGAVDFIPKNIGQHSLDIVKIKEELTSKIKSIMGQLIKFKPFLYPKRPSIATSIDKLVLPGSIFSSKRKVQVIAIGTSTGGPKALHEILPSLPEGLSSSILIVQHMPSAFTGPFAERLNKISKIQVKEAEQNDIVTPGVAFIAPGDMHMTVRKSKSTEAVIQLSKEPRDSLHMPSVDVTMSSVAETFSGKSLGIILTGMGHDGTEGIKNIKRHNGQTIAQSEETCVVFGMPKSAIQAGVIDKVVSLSQMAAEIISVS